MNDVDAVVREILAGNRERFREIVLAFEAPVRVVVGAIVPDRASVEDLVHEVFLSAYLKLDDYCPGTDFRAWIKAFARNVALNERRRWLRQRALTDAYGATLEESLGGPLDQFTALVDGETTRHLHDCVQTLAAGARGVVERYYLQGLSTAAIAEAERRKESWVHLVLFRARAALASCLEGKGVVGHG